MSENTKIEWCDHTFNPWEGCQKVGPGCDHCYAETRNARFGGGVAINWGPGAPRRRTSAANWQLPIKWNQQSAIKQAAWDKFVSAHPGMSDEQLLAAGFVKPKRPRVFCASLADVFDNAVDPIWRADLFELIAKTPYLDWLLLTKRIGNARAMLDEAVGMLSEGLTRWEDAPWPNVWIGATIVNQQEANRDIPKLLEIPASKRFLSMEPLLGPVNLSVLATQTDRVIVNALNGTAGEGFDTKGDFERGIDWVIVGGESGPGARPMNPNWVLDLRDQCVNAGVAFLFKQWGEWHTRAFQISTGAAVFRQYDNYQQWISKPQWINGGICLDKDGTELKSGRDMMDAHVFRTFPVTIMHKVGKKVAGRLLDGVQHDGFPE
ncbi:phage Gp37/Gp68 family protein [Undibacterium sp. Ji50W]|uniref:phage Gp37/Gp68 family protein n=1 Tax=Undibacterium sp. Ji50W TaxID=3413041 RepID=UPI003BF20395